MRDEYKIKRQGKEYVLYPGLLNEVHTTFEVFTISTEILEAGEKPIVKATFFGRLLDASDKEDMIQTSGIGTAGRATDRKGPAVDAPIEMAETRAKARALRDAVNIGEAAFEEMPSEVGEASEDSEMGEASEPTPASLQRGQAMRANPPKHKKTHASESPISPETVRKLRFHADTFAEARGDEPDEHWHSFLDNIGMDAAGLTEGEGQKWISRYQKGLKKLESEGANL